jgi:hypothetical protein
MWGDPQQAETYSARLELLKLLRRAKKSLMGVDGWSVAETAAIDKAVELLDPNKR